MKQSPRKPISYHHRQKSDGMVPKEEILLSSNDGKLFEQSGTIKKTQKNSLLNDKIIDSKYKEKSEKLNAKCAMLLTQLNKGELNVKNISLSMIKKENKMLLRENEELMTQYKNMKAKLKNSNNIVNTSSSYRARKLQEENIRLSEENEEIIEKIKKIKLYKNNKFLKSTTKYQMEYLVQIITGSMKELVFLLENECKINSAIDTNEKEIINDDDEEEDSDGNSQTDDNDIDDHFTHQSNYAINKSKLKRDNVDYKKRNYYINNSAINY